VGVAERLTPRRKISEIGFSWMKETLLFSFWQTNEQTNKLRRL
jgi:hypothetical protein